MGICPHALYLDMVDDLYQQVPSLYEGPDDLVTPTTFAARAILKSFYKKFVDGTKSSAESEALDKFLSTNVVVGDWSLRKEDLLDDILVGEFKHLVYKFFYPEGDPLLTSSYQLFQAGRMGPGSSISAIGSDFYTKLFSSPLSCSSEGIFRMYLNDIKGYKDWQEAEEIRFKHFGSPDIVPWNRLNFVPKNVDTLRTICTEPSLNMFYELGIGAVLEKRLNQFFGVDLSIQQDKNRELARIGSIDGSYVTFDLSSASDTISMKMLEEFIPRDQLSWFKLFRCSHTKLPNGKLEKLNMVSTMGNGFTFPLQTFLFCCVVAAAYRVDCTEMSRPRGNHLGNFAVFGDDIIVTARTAAKVKRLLLLLGFKVNSDKSFVEGPFRESCGADYFGGTSVRGVYVKTLSTQESRYTVINRLNDWTAETGLTVPLTIRRLIRSVRYLPVPLWENDDAGVKVPFSMVNKLRIDKKCQSIMYARRLVVPKVMRIMDGEIRVPRKVRKRIYNGPGLLLALLNGTVRECKVSIRLDAQRYTTKLAIAPNWEFSPTDTPTGVTNRWRLETAIRNNLLRTPRD